MILILKRVLYTSECRWDNLYCKQNGYNGIQTVFSFTVSYISSASAGMLYDENRIYWDLSNPLLTAKITTTNMTIKTPITTIKAMSVSLGPEGAKSSIVVVLLGITWKET